MKKIAFALTAFLVCGFMISACSSDKKSKKSNNIVVVVTPSTISEPFTSINSSITLSASVSVNGVVQSSPSVSWVVNPSDYGTFSPNPASTTTFTADTAKNGQGTIKASYNGTESAPIAFAINQAVVQPILNSVALVASTTSVTSPNTVTLTATAKDASNVTISGSTMTWSITSNPASVGAISSTSGESITFTPHASNTGIIRINVSCDYNGVNKTAYVDITVGSGTPAPTTLTFVLNGFTTEGGLNDIWGWGGAPAGAYTVSDPWPSMSGYDGATRQVFEMTWNSGWDGPTLVRTSSNLDASQYTTLVFYAKVASGTGALVARSVGNGGSTFEQRAFDLTSSWQKFEIPLPAARDDINSILCFVLAANEFTGAGKAAPSLPYTFYIDNVYFE